MRSFKKSMELYRELIARADGKHFASAASVVFGKKKKEAFYEERIFDLGFEFDRQLDFLCGLMPDFYSSLREETFKNKKDKIIAMAMCLDDGKVFLPFILVDVSIFKALTAFCMKEYMDNYPNVIGEQYAIFDYKIEKKFLADYVAIKESRENIRSPFYLAEEILLSNYTEPSSDEIFNVRHCVKTDSSGSVVAGESFVNDKNMYNVLTGIRVASF